MTQHAKPPYHEYQRVVRRFSMVLARESNLERLVAGMMAATVVTMQEMAPDQRGKILSLIDNDSIRVLTV